MYNNVHTIIYTHIQHALNIRNKCIHHFPAGKDLTACVAFDVYLPNKHFRCGLCTFE